MTLSDTDGTSVPRRLLDALTDRFGRVEVTYDSPAGTWTVTWTEGPTVTQMRRVAEEAAPEVSERLECRRVLSEGTIALGAVRLATGPTRDRRINPQTVEDFWREVTLPCPVTDRERALVYAVIYEVHDNHHRNEVDAHEICDLAASELARLARRAAVPLSPLETLTAHYASGPARRAWNVSLSPMTAENAFLAVHADPDASPEHIAAALTLLPELSELSELSVPLDTATAELRARQDGPHRPKRPAGPWRA